MRLLKGLIEHIREEAEDVHAYAEEAIRVREEDPPLATVYAELAREEMSHAERLHKVAVDLIERAHRAGKNPPEVMKEIWDYEHKIMIEEMAEAKAMLELHK